MFEKPRAIFFDLGMVLVRFDWEITITRLALRNGGDNQSIRDFLANPRHDAFERGELSSEEFFKFGRELTRFEGTLEEFRAAWCEIFEEIPSSMRVVRELALEFPLYLISNTNPWHAAYLEQRFNWMNLFQQRFYSCDIGFRKPDPRIYEWALTRAGVSAARALFIDDREDNLTGAREVGMQTIHAPEPDVWHQELETILFNKQKVI
ncbi:MAG TPA: HAD family phosphatase [Anaerolineae bacterium]|nr:HAD family phosphatase [Anaerolineae bacterium]